MKAMNKTQLAAYAGVCVETLSNWLEPHQEELAAMGYKPGNRSIPPNVVEWICRRFLIDIEPPQHLRPNKRD